MPWETTNVMEARIRLVVAYMARQVTMTSLCLLYGVSRKTGYKWVAEFLDKGLAGLGDRSRAPGRGRHWTTPATAALIIQVRKAHPRWGARKILGFLRLHHRGRRLPSATAAHEILRQAGLIKARRRRARWREHGGRRAGATRPNQLWTIDFKGQFRTKDGRYCYPLTVVDAYSRYILGCIALPAPTFEATWAAFEKLFIRYGLPDAIHSDNGEPFASQSAGGLSRLSVRFLRLGIRIQRSRPGHPQDNGSHERMHLTLKQETTRPPEADLTSQQARFDAFCAEFNHERPHQALGQIPPARLYKPSRRLYVAKPAHLLYPRTFLVRRVTGRGTIKWQGHLVFLSETLIGQSVGLYLDNGAWHVYFGTALLGRVNEKRWRIEPTTLMKKEKA